MDISTKVRMAIAHSGFSNSQIAEKMGTSLSNLSQKIKRGKLRKKDLDAIADACNAKYFFGFDVDGSRTAAKGTKEKIKFLCAVCDIKQADVARECGWLPQTLSAKISNDTFTVDDFEQMAKATDSEFYYGFEFDDGTTL